MFNTCWTCVVLNICLTCVEIFPVYREILQSLILSFLWLRLNSVLFERDFKCVLMTNVLLKFNFIPITNDICPIFVSLIFIWPWFPALSLGDLYNCCIVSLTPLSAGQTIATYVTSAIPRLVSLFSLCTAGLKTLTRLTIGKQMKMQYIYRIINCI